MKFEKAENKPLNVQFAPIFNKNKFKTFIVSKAGEEIKISPIVVSNPPVSTYSWYKFTTYGKIPLISNRQFILNKSKRDLKIILAPREKLIKIQVKAENELGWNFCNITVAIKCELFL